MSAAAEPRRANAGAGSLTLNLMRLRTFIALFAVLLFFSFAAPNWPASRNDTTTPARPPCACAPSRECGTRHELQPRLRTIGASHA